MRVEHPHITAFDHSIHAYLVGSKYGIRRLRDLGLHRYIQFGALALKMHLSSPNACAPIQANLSPGAFQALTLLLKTMPEDGKGGAEPVHPLVFSFLDSLFLVWRNTSKRADHIRMATLKLIKPYLNRLLKIPYFAVLMKEVKDLEGDIIHGLARDGLVATVRLTLADEKGGMRFNNEYR